jgi:D-psicose/D-tagatose/L-ribulose 3-epimerase
MPTFGIHAFTWNGTWDNDIAEEIIRQTAQTGFDLLEIPILRPAEFDAPKIKKLLKDYKLRGVGSLALPKDTHLPFYPDKALNFLKLVVDKLEVIEATMLGGCIYCNLGTLTGKAPTVEERQRCIDVLGELANYARPRGIQLGIEPVNRYETYMYNIGDDAAELIHQIGADDMFIHWDTYHMNIEEQGFSAPIKRQPALSRYIHLSESDRGIVGQGNVDWDDTFAGLKAVNYTGPLVLESFAAVNEDLAGATCMWRLANYNGQELASQGLAFLREKASAYGLA